MFEVLNLSEKDIERILRELTGVKMAESENPQKTEQQKQEVKHGSKPASKYRLMHENASGYLSQIPGHGKCEFGSVQEAQEYASNNFTSNAKLHVVKIECSLVPSNKVIW